ncbi:MAG TPA: ABC transporter permease [Bdellovibrionales bacterium]|nr:ABC transporter permease [Bdellovibrionales bacterium]
MVDVLKVSMRLSWHIVRRNWVVYKKDFIANISPTLSDPAFFMLSLGIGLGAFITEIEGLSYAAFLAPGLAAMSALFTSFFESSYGFFVRMTFENIFKAMLTTPIGVKEVFIGEMIWVALKGGVMSFMVALVLVPFGLVAHVPSLPLIFFIGCLIALACGAIGLIATALVHNINQFQTVYSFIISPLMFFSGIFYPLKQSPEILQWIALCFPVSHGVLASQSVFWARDLSKAFSVHVPILCLQALILCLIAYKLIRPKLQQ